MIKKGACIKVRYRLCFFGYLMESGNFLRASEDVCLFLRHPLSFVRIPKIPAYLVKDSGPGNTH
jgi:hypothetical protein